MRGCFFVIWSWIILLGKNVCPCLSERGFRLSGRGVRLFFTVFCVSGILSVFFHDIWWLEKKTVLLLTLFRCT